MRKIAIVIILLSLSLVSSSQIQRPKLVIGLVIDQMRWDYLYYYYNKFSNDGLKRIVDNGFSCENTMINYVPTVTAVGHASIFTGSVPALNGICGNSFRIDGKLVSSVDDKTVKTVGSTTTAGQTSPRNLLASTIGDELKIATDFKSKVIGISLKDRAAILPAGHGADAAFWYDKKVGHFISSSYYMDKLPSWLDQFNRTNQTKPGFDPINDPIGVNLTFNMSKAAIENEQLGVDDVTDFLSISISTTDGMGHSFGTRGIENQSVYMELDKDLSEFLQFLDNKVGKDNYLLFLTADHGAAHNPNFLKSHKINAGGFNNDSIKTQLNSYLKNKFGYENVVLEFNSNRIYLDRKLIKNQYQLVKQAAIDFLKENKDMQFIIDYEKAAQTTIPMFIRERIINGYHPDRSGDIYFVTKPQFIEGGDNPKYMGTTHSVWNPYDSHIPLLFYGWKIKHGNMSNPTYIVDIAPTVCQLLHIQMPNACIGSAITEVISK